MIRIKAVDAQNILDVCKLTKSQDGIGLAIGRCSCCNAISIAEAKYAPGMHPHAIYHNHVLIGFFMYQRAENQADTATIYRFMIDDRFQQRGLEEKALEHILKGLKIQGVKKVVFIINSTNGNAKNLSLSFGFQFTGKMEHSEYYYALKL